MDKTNRFEQRTIRVFVSSTFKDMHGEREELVKFTFPELRKRCRERAVEFVDVDLRWGVTDEKKSEGKVLPICLAEIERCRPYFIGILGERYGWVPQDIDSQLLDAQEWLKEHREKSVTELEILHSVLNDPQMKKLTFFYFRDPNTSERVEQELNKAADYLPEPQVSKEKLKRLKEKIREDGYPIKENYANAKSLGQYILEDLWKVIEKRFPQEEVPSPLERERMEHQAFATARIKVYIAQEEYFNRLDKHVSSESPPLVLTGESGCGKSALIANWAERYNEKHPEDFIVMHFIGSSAESTNHISILRRIMEEIFERLNQEENIPNEPEDIINFFPVLLKEISARERVILILDGLNQLEDIDNSQILNWLPTYFPTNVRVILTCLLGCCLEVLYKRGYSTWQIQLLSLEEKRNFIIEYLAQYTKELESSQVELIAVSDQTSNPIYLRALLEELRVYGDYHTLQKRIKFYLNARTTDKLYERILERWEGDYERERLGLVGESLSFIWASRKGLTETEILELLGSEGKNLPRAHWSPFYLAVEESLINHGGLLNFFHNYIRQAVEKRYLSTYDQQSLRHLQLADYFEKRNLIDERTADELPWQLVKTKTLEPASFINKLTFFLENRLKAGKPGITNLISKHISSDYWYHSMVSLSKRSDNSSVLLTITNGIVQNLKSLPVDEKEILIIGMGKMGLEVLKILMNTGVREKTLLAIDMDPIDIEKCQILNKIVLPSWGLRGITYRDGHPIPFSWGGIHGGGSGFYRIHAIGCSEVIINKLGKIKNALIVTALGGKTSAGVAPVVIGLLKSMKVRTIVFSLTPFQWEWKPRVLEAERSKILLSQLADNFYVFSSDELAKNLGSTPAIQVFEILNKMLVEKILEWFNEEKLVKQVFDNNFN